MYPQAAKISSTAGPEALVILVRKDTVFRCEHKRSCMLLLDAIHKLREEEHAGAHRKTNRQREGMGTKFRRRDNW
jgi:hypothetical protein